MRASPEFISLFLRGLAWDANELGKPLLELVAVAGRGTLYDSPRGKTLVSPPVALTLPPLGSLREADIHEVCASILRVAQSIRERSPALSDDAVYARVLDHFRVQRAA